MNLKLFKKIIKNLLKFVAWGVSIDIKILRFLEDLLVKLENKLSDTAYLLEEKPPRTRYFKGSYHDILKDIGYIHRKE